MKVTAIVILITFLAADIFAQSNINVESSTKNMSQGTNPGFSVFIPEADNKDVEKLWKKTAKKYGGKTSSSKGEIFCDNASISSISSNTIDIYAMVEKGTNGCIFTCFFDLGGAYISKSHDGYGTAEKMVHDFAIEAAKEAVQGQVDDLEKQLKVLENDLKHLVKDKENLAKNIEKWKEDIAKAEEETTQNDADQLSKQGDIKAQTETIDQTKEKLKKIK
ncbi:MAG: hypothetical protein IH946_09535 [Bacteroidetes bacterium]|nr:hypothetical protein [Bacteroidota bacterium]